MKIFIDSANVSKIEECLASGLCDGVTTNPTICSKDGARFKEIVELIYPRLVHLEVTSEEDLEILNQAEKYNSLADNVVVKVTATTSSGKSLLPVVFQLVKKGITVNVTAMTTYNQLILAAKCIENALEGSSSSKTHFISVFAGRIADKHGSKRAFEIISRARKWLDFYNIKGIEIIVGSIRSPQNVESWSRAGAHILTISPEIIGKCMASAKTNETVAQFLADARELT